MSRKIISKSPEETEGIAEEVAEKVKNGGLIALFGDLGSGKTTFTKGVSSKLGVKERIISPTFLIVRMHKTKSDRDFYHIDLYRLKEDVDSIGLSEILSNRKNIVVIEWAEKAKELLPIGRIDVHFNYKSEKEREISIVE